MSHSHWFESSQLNEDVSEFAPNDASHFHVYLFLNEETDGQEPDSKYITDCYVQAEADVDGWSYRIGPAYYIPCSGDCTVDHPCPWLDPEYSDELA